VIALPEIFLLFFSTFASVGLFTPIMRKIALKTNFVDKPNASHKSHQEPIPYLGGLAIIFGVSLVIYTALIIQDVPSSDFWLATSLLGPALALGLVGLIDDWKVLPPLPRFIAQSAAGTFTAALIIITNTEGNPTGHISLDILITVFWVVGICNSINFFDNLDGGAAGAIAAASFGLFLIARDSGQYLLSATSVTVFGAVLGFLIWNKSPAKIYMGDAGSLFLGTIIAVLTIRLNPEVTSQSISFAIPVLLLAVPILDTCVAVVSRRRRGHSIFQGGKDHLSHRLMRSGLDKKQSAYVLWATASFFAGIAVLFSKSDVSAGVFLVFVCVIWLALLFAFLRTSDE
jgi:UDP-GlcNAc:undecaprenyl-phosphate GlcNAc-1-phosphate transferase